MEQEQNDQQQNQENQQQNIREMTEEERREYEEWNAEHGYTDQDFVEFDMDDVRFTEDGMEIQNLENYPEIRDAMDQFENDNDDSQDEDVERFEDDTIYLLNHHQDAVISVCFSPVNSNIIASGGCDEVGFVQNLEVEDEVHKLEGHTDTLSVSFSKDGKYLATAGMDAIIKIWNPETGELIHTLEGASESIESVSWFNKGPLVLAAGGDSLVWLWDAASGAMMGVFAGHEGPVIQAKFSGDNKKIISASAQSIRVWNPKDSTSPLLTFNEQVHNFHGEDDDIVTLAPHYESNLVLSGGLQTLVLSNIDSGKVLFHTPVEEGVESCCFNENFPVFVSGSLSGKVVVWDAHQLQPRLNMTHDSGVIKVMNVPNTTQVATCSLDRTSRVWDTRSGEEVIQLLGHTAEILDMDISHDGKYLASSGEDMTVRVFDLRIQKELTE